jgi:hypothetical protein
LHLQVTEVSFPYILFLSLNAFSARCQIGRFVELHASFGEGEANAQSLDAENEPTILCMATIRRREDVDSVSTFERFCGCVATFFVLNAELPVGDAHRRTSGTWIIEDLPRVIGNFAFRGLVCCLSLHRVLIS